MTRTVPLIMESPSGPSKPSPHLRYVWLLAWCSKLQSAVLALYQMEQDTCQLKSSIFAHLSSSLSNRRIITAGLIWSKQNMQILRCSSGFCSDFLDDLMMHLWRNFGGLATSGKIHRFPCFLYLEVMTLSVVGWSQRVVEMAL